MLFTFSMKLIFILQVYSRCVLESKKRYVGFMYETIDQVNPVFDAKGIETVRRDSCSATAKVKKSYGCHISILPLFQFPFFFPPPSYLVRGISLVNNRN